MIKTIVRIFSVVAVVAMLVVGLAPVRMAYAQAGLTWTSGVQVYNPGTIDANVTFTYYNQSDGSIAGTIKDVILAGSSTTYFPITGVVAGFNGSLVISADQHVSTINNLITTDGNYTSSTTGFDGGSASVSIPLISCNNSGYNSFFAVQNAGNADANITITYVPGAAGASGVTESGVIHAGQSTLFDQGPASTTKNCTQLGAGSPSKFIGSASIASNQPIVATANLVNTTTFPTLSGYNAFTGGSATVVLPLVMANNSGFYTGIQIQNVGAGTTTATITFGPNTVSGSSFQPVAETCALNAGQSCTKLQAGGSTQWATQKYIGSATITTSPAMNIDAIVNQVGAVGLKKMADAYDGFNPASATTTIDMPLISANNSTWYTGVQVMNVGTGTCTTVTMKYGPNTKGVYAPVNETVANLAFGASKTWIENGGVSAVSANNWTTAGRYIGSGTITGVGAGCSIVAVVNQTSGAGLGDTFMTYNAFNR